MLIKQFKPGQIGEYWLSKKPGRDKADDAWCRTWYDKDARQTRRISLGTTDIQKASLALANWAVLNERPDNGRPDEVLVETVLISYWEEHGKHVTRPDSLRLLLSKWQTYWAGKTVADVTPAEQRKFRAWLGEGQKRPSTIDKVLSAGRAALTRAEREQEITSAPHIRLIEQEEDRRSRAPLGRPITIPEMAQVFDAAREYHMLMYLVLLANTLGRSSALFDLRRVQYDEVHERLDLNPPARRQTKKYRPIIPVSQTLRPWLLSLTGAEQNYITFRGRPIKAAKSGWSDIHKALGVNDISAYSFRHGMARELRKRKVPLEQISLMLGHLPRGSDKTTSIYAPFDPDYCGDAMHAIENVMNEVRSLVKTVDLSSPASMQAKLGKHRSSNLGLTDEHRKTRDRLLTKGVPVAEIARRLGVTTTAIYKAKKAMLES